MHVHACVSSASQRAGKPVGTTTGSVPLPPKGTQAGPGSKAGAKLEPATRSCPEKLVDSSLAVQLLPHPQQHIPPWVLPLASHPAVPNLPSFHPHPAGLPARLP